MIRIENLRSNLSFVADQASSASFSLVVDIVDVFRALLVVQTP
jgi:CRISPR/Cas system-associated endonuclease Cas1